MPSITLSRVLFATYVLFSHSSSAAPISDEAFEIISCAKWTLPVAVTADNLIFDVPRVDSNLDAANYAWYQDTWSTPNLTVRTRSVLHVDQTFGINVQLCFPSTDSRETLQIATHGLGFDKRYWDVEVEADKYSYVHAAVKAGYSILTYDRLGTGLSDKPDAYSIVQAPLQLEILRKLTIMARNGDLAEAAKSHFAQHIILPNFTKFVHIGHSFGSTLTNALQARYPRLSDGAIQTAWLLSDHFGVFSQAAFGYQYARENDPNKFKDRGSGYIVTGTKNSFQQLFLAEDSLDPKLLEYGNSIKQPGTVGEGSPTELIFGLPALNFTGPQLYFLAERDLPVCDGDCKGVYDTNQLRKKSFPKASDFEVYVQPGAGHGLTLHMNATAGYQVMFDFLGKNGL